MEGFAKTCLSTFLTQEDQDLGAQEYPACFKGTLFLLQFKRLKKFYTIYIRFTTLTIFFKVQFIDIKYIYTAEQTSPPSICKTVFVMQNRNSVPVTHSLPVSYPHPQPL